MLFRSGSLLYLTASRPDIMFSICLCARFQACPKESHLSVVKRIFRYLIGTQNLGLWYPRGTSFDLISFSDADYASSKIDRKSTSVLVNSLVICLCHGVVKSKIQLLFPLLKLNTLQLEIVVLKFFGLSNN